MICQNICWLQFTSFPFSSWKTVTGIHSPTTTNSFFLSRSRSTHAASVTIPSLESSGQIFVFDLKNFLCHHLLKYNFLVFPDNARNHSSTNKNIRRTISINILYLYTGFTATNIGKAIAFDEIVFTIIQIKPILQ